MGLPFARCELRYHSLSQTFYIIKDLKGSRSPPPPLPYHTLTPLTNSKLSVTHFAVLTTEQEHVESEAYSVSLIHIIFLTEFSVATFLFISSNQSRRNGRQANLYVRGKVEEQSFTYPHQR